ncbi:MAG: lytic transglycosylase domain-containing protein, partial [Bdellovibrionota bacterium]
MVRSALRRVIKYGKTLESKKQELALSPRVAKFEKVATDRVKLHQRALELSKEIGNEEEAAQAQIRLEETAPRFLKEPKPEQFAAVASDLRKNRDFNEARAMYGKIIASAEASDLEKLSALDGIRMSFKLENRVDDYIAATHTFSEFARVHFLLPGLRSFKKDRSGARALLGRYLETQMILARAVWTDNSPGKARVILQAAERDVKNKIPVAESVFTRARIEEEAGRYDQTLKLLSGIDLAEVDNRELRTKILWSHAWNLRKAKKLEDAEKALRTLVSEDESVTSTTSRNRFWFGKTLQQLKKDDEAKAQFEILAEKDRVGWYGLLAYRELVRPFPKMTVVETRGPASEKNEEAALLPDESLTFEWLIATGENDLGLSFLEHTLKNKRAGFNNAQTLDALRLYARAGSFQTVFTRIQELPADTRTAILDTNPELMFPQPWTPVVAAAAGKFNLPSELIYSIMRQESAFNPLARSGADAFGLMQLIPMAAKKASATSGIPFDHHEELYTPETNIPLGASFIKGLLKNWNDGFIPTVASYNASDKAIAGWIRSRYRGDILEFIEDVPYEETRTYIKLVMRNYVFYRRLNAGQAE